MLKNLRDSRREIDHMMKRFLLLAAIGGLVFATSLAPADAAPRTRAADGTEAAAAGSTQRSQSTRNRRNAQSQKADRRARSSSANKAKRNRAPRQTTRAG